MNNLDDDILQQIDQSIVDSTLLKANIHVNYEEIKLKFEDYSNLIDLSTSMMNKLQTNKISLFKPQTIRFNLYIEYCKHTDGYKDLAKLLLQFEKYSRASSFTSRIEYITDIIYNFNRLYKRQQRLYQSYNKNHHQIIYQV